MGKSRPAAGRSSGGPAAVGSRSAAPAGSRCDVTARGDPPGQDEVLRRVSAAVLAVTRELSVGDVLQVIVRSVRSLAGARYAALGVPDDHGSFAEFVVDGISERQRKAIGPLPRQHGMLAVMLREGQPLRLADIHADPRFEGWPAAHPDLADILAMPIKDGDRVLGFIFAANKMAGGGGGFTERDEEVLALFAAHAAIALTNARLYERARQLSVLEERARLARDLHDAVSQKLFSIRVKARAASVLASRDPATGIPTGRRPRWRAWPPWPVTRRPSCARSSTGWLRRRSPRAAWLGRCAGTRCWPARRTGCGSGSPLTGPAGAGRGPGGRAVPDRTGSAAQRAAPLRGGRGRRVGVRGGQAGHAGGERPGQRLRPGRAAGGRGLPSLRERAAGAGASLVIRSAPGRGTTVRVVMPVGRAGHGGPR